MSPRIEMPAALFVDLRVLALPLAARAVLADLHYIAMLCSGAGEYIPLPRGSTLKDALLRSGFHADVEYLEPLFEAGLIQLDADRVRLILASSGFSPPPSPLPRTKSARTVRTLPNRPPDRVSARAPKTREVSEERQAAKRLSALFSKLGLDSAEQREQWFAGPQGRRAIARLELTDEQVRKAIRSAGRRAGQFGSARDACVGKHSAGLAPQTKRVMPVEVGTGTVTPLAPSPSPTTPSEPTPRAVSETSFSNEFSNQSAAAARATEDVPRANLGANHRAANDSIERGATADSSPRIIDALLRRLGPHSLSRDGGPMVERRIEKCLLDAIEREPRLGEHAGLDAIAAAIRDRSKTWPTWHAVKSGRLRMSLTLLAGEPGPDGERPCTMLLEAVAAACAGFDDARREPQPAERVAVEVSRPGPRATADDARKLNPFTRTVA